MCQCVLELNKDDNANLSQCQSKTLTSCTINRGHCLLHSHPTRKCSIKNVSLWNEFTNWDTTPTHPAIISQNNRCRRGAAEGELVWSASGTFQSMAKAGHGEDLKPGAQTRPHSSSLGYWATRTMSWWSSWETVRGARTSTLVPVIARETIIVPRELRDEGWTAEQISSDLCKHIAP